MNQDGPDVRDAGAVEAGTSARRGRRVDPLSAVAHVVFALVGGLLVFAFAWMLEPTAAALADTGCRPLSPEPRSGVAPDLALQSLDGQPVSLSDYRGKFVVINFWATWCEPCAQEWPGLDKLARRLQGRDDVVVLAVSVDENREDIAPYLRRLHLEESGVVVLWDPSAEANKAFGSTKLPDTYFVDESGQLQRVFINVRAWGKADAFRCVDTSIGS